MQDRCNARKDVILPADLLGEMCFEVAKLFETVGGRAGEFICRAWQRIGWEVSLALEQRAFREAVERRLT